jgi:hypothetical protein
MKNVFDYNPKQCYGYDFADDLVNKLKKQGFKARADMGISQMRIFSDAPQKVVDSIVKEY